MKERKTIVTLLVLIVLVAFTVAFKSGRFWLGKTEFDSNYSTVVATPGNNDSVEGFNKRIGIMVSNLEVDQRLKEKLAQYLRHYLVASGHNDVYLLQKIDHLNAHVDLVLLVNMNVNLSKIPFVKTGTIEYSVNSFSFNSQLAGVQTQILNMEHYGETKVKFSGLISQNVGYDLMIEACMREFVETFNRNLNKNFKTYFSENLEATKLRQGAPKLKNMVDEAALAKYQIFVPVGVDNLCLYHHKGLSDGVLISYSTTMDVSSLTSFYKGLDSLNPTIDFFEYYRGSSYQSMSDDKELNIKIHYKNEKIFSFDSAKKELERKTVTVFYQEKPPLI